MTKLALVTGANRGLGLEVCRQLGSAGFRLIATSRDLAAGERAVSALREDGIDVAVEPLDAASESNVAELAARLRDRNAELDVVVNNAGVSMSGFDANVAERTIRTNFFGALWVTDAPPKSAADGRG